MPTLKVGDCVVLFFSVSRRYKTSSPFRAEYPPPLPSQCRNPPDDAPSTTRPHHRSTSAAPPSAITTALLPPRSPPSSASRWSHPCGEKPPTPPPDSRVSSPPHETHSPPYFAHPATYLNRQASHGPLTTYSPRHSKTVTLWKGFTNNSP